MFDTTLVLLVIAGLLVVVGISQPLAVRLRLPPSVLLAAIGVAIGALPVVLGRLGLSGPVDFARVVCQPAGQLRDLYLRFSATPGIRSRDCHGRQADNRGRH